MFSDRGRICARVLSVAVATTMAAATTLVAVSPSNADEVYRRPADDTITLSGHGSGHGHGMSQWGAYGAAVVGKLSWESIVASSYPGTTRMHLGNPTIRVRLDSVGQGTLYLPTPDGLTLGGSPLPGVISGFPVTRYRVSSRYFGGLQVEGLSSVGWKLHSYQASPAVLTNPSHGNIVDVLLANGARRGYRGSIVANWTTPTRLTAVSVVPMESYLRAVVPAEMPTSWHANALAAQAVAARSYANFDRANVRAGQTWDTCDTTSCQMYSGVQAEMANSDAAVWATAGQTLTYGGRAAFTQFSASNGGWSVAGSRPYLVTKADSYDGAIANSANSWTTSITVARIQARWPSIGTYRQLRVISRDGQGQWGGRVLTAAIDGSSGTVNITGRQFSAAFGLKSEWFTPTNSRSAPSYPRDLSGDNKADVLAVVAGTGALRMYAGNGAAGWTSVRGIGTGFGRFSKVLTAGTWDAGAISDVLAQKSDGSLWLYPGTAAGPLGTPRKVGTGWGIYNLIIPVGDFGGDGRSDLIARRPDGTLMLYSGNGRGGFQSISRLGSGWGGFTSLFSPGDFDRDGKADVIARSPSGLLYLYPGNGSGGWLPRRLIGRGWSTYSTITSPGDLNGDGKADVLARTRDGIVWLCIGNGTGGFLARRAIDTGWNAFSTVLP